MRVGVVTVQVFGHRVTDGAGNLRSAGAVEVGDRLVLVHAMQCGKCARITSIAASSRMIGRPRLTERRPERSNR